jgi:hypothetical protein
MDLQIFLRASRQKLLKSLLQGAMLLLSAWFIFMVILLVSGRTEILNWVLAVAAAILLIVAFAINKAYFAIEKRQRSMVYRFFFTGIRTIIVITLLLGIWGVFEIFHRADCGPCAIYQAIGLSLVIIWACIFMAYFIWAIYYYNINLGIPEEVWDRINDAKEAKRAGDYYDQDDIDEEPNVNPYQSETFGLPNGTVRGMIAFTLLFGALAMLIVSIGMENEIDPNTLFWDQYDFFKTAFLMMIAFYFGTRALQYLNTGQGPIGSGGGGGAGSGDNNGGDSGGDQSGSAASGGGGGLGSLVDTLKDTIKDKFIDPMDAKGEEKETQETTKSKPKTTKGKAGGDMGFVDPMQPKK